MTITFQIRFDRPHAAYFAGDTVSGRLLMKLDKKKKIQAVSFHFKGAASVRWVESAPAVRTRMVSTSSGTRTITETHHEPVTYAAHETYFDRMMYFLGSDQGELEVNPGEYVFQFECPLPATLPSSLEGEHGHIRYTAKALMHRPWKFDHGAKAAFTVVSKCDLNALPYAREPINITRSKTVCCLWCTSGPITVTVSLPAGGFVPGQAIVVQVQVENASRSPVEHVTCSLKKEVSWHGNLVFGSLGSMAARQKTRLTQTKLAKFTFEQVPARASRNYSQVVAVPAVPPSNLNNCGIIDWQYTLKVVAGIGGCTSNLEAKVPILVGTTPLRSIVYPNPTAEPHMAQEPSAPDLPPPSYEECIFKGNSSIMDPDAGDNEYTAGAQHDFTPRYPVYPMSPQAAPAAPRAPPTYQEVASS